MQHYEQLTHREMDVLRRIIEGDTNKEIAFHLHIAPKTVEARIAQICAKLGARSRTEAAVRAICWGIAVPHWYREQQANALR